MRVFLVILNGVGVGSLPNYLKYSDSYTNTMQNFCSDLNLSNLKKMGLYSLLHKDVTDDKVIGHYARGRMLCQNNSFESGFEEILGNVCANNNKENLLSILKKNNINTLVLSSGKNNYADICYDSDEELCSHFNVESILDNSVIILNMNDFAKYGLQGDILRMTNCIVAYDEFIGTIMQNLHNDDLLIVSGNFGVDIENKKLSREYNPILIFSKMFMEEVNLNTVIGNNCIAYTIADLLNVYYNDKSLISDRTKANIIKAKDYEIWENALKYIDKIKEDIGGLGERINVKIGIKTHRIKKETEIVADENLQDKKTEL